MERDEEIARLRLERTTATREKGGSKRGGKLNIRLPEQPNVDHELESSPLGEVLLPYEEGQARKPGRQRSFEDDIEAAEREPADGQTEREDMGLLARGAGSPTRAADGHSWSNCAFVLLATGLALMLGFALAKVRSSIGMED